MEAMNRALPTMTRRHALVGAGASASFVLGAPQALAQAAGEKLAALLPSAGICVLTPQAVEGPYYFDPKLERADITEGGAGVPLALLLQVVEASDCAPLSAARIDAWHASAVGYYSGYDRQGDDQSISTKGATFLRGTQFTDAKGEVSFATVYPGWYRGRTPHIHFKVFLDQKTLVTGQIYFPDALSEFIYENVSPYRERKASRDTTNASDGVLQSSGGDRSTFCNIKEEKDRYVASLIIGIDRTATPSAAPGPGGPGGPPPGNPPPGGEPGPSPVIDKGALVPRASG
jgi:protocatechuate 3,4-dioxygenase beta subunit